MNILRLGKIRFIRPKMAVTTGDAELEIEVNIVMLSRTRMGEPLARLFVSMKALLSHVSVVQLIQRVIV